MHFPEYINSVEVKDGNVALVWLGQAGFLIKTAGGKIIVIDPCLTDYTYRIFEKEQGQGFRRMTIPPFEPGEVDIDILLCSHEHEDHLDMDALPIIMQNAGAKCVTNAPSVEKARNAGLDVSKFTAMQPGEALHCGEFELLAVGCDHGCLAPLALGFILDFGFTSVYYSGDTCHNRDRLKTALEFSPQVALLPINGAFGNLDAEQASQLADSMGSKLCVPHHFWTFPLHSAEKGSPFDAIEYFGKNAQNCRLLLMRPAKTAIIGEGGVLISCDF